MSRTITYIVWLLLMGLSVVGPYAGLVAADEIPSPNITSAKLVSLLDLLKLPRLNVDRVLDESATYLYYSAKASVPGAAAFYNGELTSQGWTVVPSSTSDPQYPDVLYVKDGNYVRLTVGVSGDAGIVGVSLTHLGNIDMRSLPRCDNANVDPDSSPLVASHRTPLSIADAAALSRRLLTEQGWLEYRDSLGEVPSVPHVKNFNVCRGPVRVMVSVLRDPRDPNRRDTMVSYIAHFALPFDVPVLPEAQNLVLNTYESKVEYQISQSVDQVADAIRTAARPLEWQERKRSQAISATGGSLVMVEPSETNAFVVQLKPADQGTHVLIERLPLSEMRAEATASTNDGESDKSTDNDLAQGDSNRAEVDDIPEDPLASSEADRLRNLIEEQTNAAKSLRNEIQDSVKKEMESVQGELQKLGLNLPSNLLNSLKEMEDDEEEEKEENGDDDWDDEDDEDEDEDEDEGKDDEDTTPEVPVRDDSAALAKLPRLKSSCKIDYAGTTYTLPHVLSFKKVEGGVPVIMFSQSPLNVGKAQRSLAKGEDPSVIDLRSEQGFPPSLEIRLEPSFTSFSCFVDGASINRGSNDFQLEHLVSPQRVRGTITSPAGEDVFDKPFQFTATFDVDFLSATSANVAQADVLVADAQYDFPVPEGCRNVGQEKSPYRRTLQAQLDGSLSQLRAFYTKALTQAGWKPQGRPNVTAQSSRSTWQGPGGQLSLSLREESDVAYIEAVVRDSDKARADGVAPAEGQVLLLLANAGEEAVVLTVAKKSHNLPPGKGAQNPRDAIKIPVTPGKQTVQYVVGGKKGEETLEVEAGTTWGVIAVPGGGIFTNQLY